MFDVQVIVISFCQSRNGTFVNDKRVKREQKLRIGDFLGLGTNPFPVRNFDEHQIVFSLCSAPEKVIMDEINMELFSLGTTEPDFSGINIDDILKRLEDDSNLSKDAIDMDINDRLSCAIFQEEFKSEQKQNIKFEQNQNKPTSELKPETKVHNEPIKVTSRPKEVDGLLFCKTAALWDTIDLENERYHPKFYRLSVKVPRISDVDKFIDPMIKSSAKKRKLLDSPSSTPKKIAKLAENPKQQKKTSKTIKKESKFLKCIFDELDETPIKSKKSSHATPSSKVMTKSPASPVTTKTNRKQKLDNVKGSPHPHKIKASTAKAAVVKATANDLNEKTTIEASVPRGKRSDLSPVKQYRIISKKPPKQLKSILIKSSTENKKKVRKKDARVTFCSSVYIKEYIQEDDFDSEP